MLSANKKSMAAGLRKCLNCPVRSPTARPEMRRWRVPKGYDKEHPLAEYLKNRHFFCETTLNLHKRSPKDLAAWIGAQLEAAYPLVKWLRSASN